MRRALSRRHSSKAPEGPPASPSKLTKSRRPNSRDDSYPTPSSPLDLFTRRLPDAMEPNSPSLYSPEMSQQDHAARRQSVQVVPEFAQQEPQRQYSYDNNNSNPPQRQQSYQQQQPYQQQQQPLQQLQQQRQEMLSQQRAPSPSNSLPRQQERFMAPSARPVSRDQSPAGSQGRPNSQQSLRRAPPMDNNMSRSASGALAGNGNGNGDGPASFPQERQQSMGPQKEPLTTIGGERLHDLPRAVALLRSSKFYAEGFLMKRVEATADGRTNINSPDAQWAKWFVQLSGTIMSIWNAAEMESAARENRTVPPQYLNLSDAFLHPFPPSPRGPPSPTPFQFAINTAGVNRILFCAPSEESLQLFINAIRLAGWERSRCNEIYTGALLGTREPKTGWSGYDGGLTGKGKLEGWLKARLPGDTEWRKVWAVVNHGIGSNASVTTKKVRRSSILSFGRKPAEAPPILDLPGDGALSTIAFYSDKPIKQIQPICIAQHVFYAAAIYPESDKLVDISSLFKIEGTFLNASNGYKGGWGVGGRAEKQAFALLMLDEGDAMAMLEWIVGISDAFKLYGRPRVFSYDPRDPSSLYFALPVGPHRDRMFLDRELVDHLPIGESRPRAIRAVFHNILFDRMRGVRPAALANAPSGDAQRAGSPQSRLPLSRSATADLDQVQSFSQRAASPKVAPFLPPIGEAADAEPISAEDSRGALVATNGNYRAGPQDAASPRSGSEPTDSLSNYTNFLDSDASRQATPPPTQSFRRSQFSPPLAPINTSSSPNYSRPSMVARESSEALSYARASPSEAQPELEAAQSLYLPPTRNFTAALPSPGALSIVEDDESARYGSGSSARAPGGFAAQMVQPPQASMGGVHNGKVVDSPETLPLDAPAQASYSTAPLFAPALVPVTTSSRAPAPAPVQQQATPGQDYSFVRPDDLNIHSDLLAALDFVERTDSPPLNDNPHSAEPSPVPPRNGSTFGPPLRTPIISPPSPIDEEYGSQVSQQPSLHRSGDATAQTSVSSLPSSFAKNKRGEERVLAAAVAQQAQQQALSRPGRSKGQGKQRAWVDSDEDTVEDEESEEEEAEMDAATRQRMSRMPTPPNGLSQEQYYASQQGRQSYYDNGHQSPQLAPQPDEPSPNRTRPFVNPNGLLHAGIIEKEERSARALENEARVNGGPLVSIPSKPPPPQTGLVGAITSHQRDKERTGGVGRALTEQQREKKLAEQRQRQLDDFQRQQLVQQQQQQQMMMQQHAQMQQYGGGYQNPMMMMNPWMMGGMGGMGGMGYGGMPMAPQGSSPMGMPPPGSVMGAPGTPQPPASPAPGGQGHQLSPSQSMQMDPMMMQQQVFQQQAMMAAQQAYAQAMMQFSPPPPMAPPAGSPQPGGMSSHPSMSFGPSYFAPPAAGAPPPSQFGQQPYGGQFGNPYGGGFNPYGQPGQFMQPPGEHSDVEEGSRRSSGSMPFDAGLKAVNEGAGRVSSPLGGARGEPREE